MTGLDKEIDHDQAEPFGSVSRRLAAPAAAEEVCPSQTYEVFTATLTSSATQRKLAETYGGPGAALAIAVDSSD